jgi:hypothetical protein
MKWALLAGLGLVVLLVLAVHNTEYFVDTEFRSGGTTGTATAVTRPCVCSGPTCPSACRAWESKVTANAPSGAVTADYISVLAAFFDTVYDPATTKPTAAQVNTFLASSAGTVAGVDVPSVRRIIMDAFRIESGVTSVVSELAGQNFVPEAALLEDKMARDEVRTRAEKQYKPAVPKSSTQFSEGPYAPITQTNPNYPGDWDDGSTTWKGVRPASVCPCAENIV